MEPKKISSEIKLNNTDMKIKVGTTDKKQPKSVYFDFGLYITPAFKQDSYSDEIKKFDHNFKTKVSNIINSSKHCNKNFIFVSDVADCRIVYGKKSYLNLQLYLSLKNDFLQKENYDFKKIAKELENCYIDKLTQNITSTIHENGFNCSKFKNSSYLC